MCINVCFVERYDETFDGVLLAYDLTVGSKQAKILAGLAPYFGVRVNTKLLLFDPKPNSLVGKQDDRISIYQWYVVSC